MNNAESQTRQKIFQAALDLIAAGEDAGSLTTRQIAARAGVNPALVNYYYQTKENLLSQVVGEMMGGIADQVQTAETPPAPAAVRLRRVLQSTADTAFRHYHLCRIAVALELKRGCPNACALVLPLLREITPERSEAELQIIALQLLLPFHHIVLEPQLYHRRLETDFFDPAARRQKIDAMLDCVLAGITGEVKP